MHFNKFLSIFPLTIAVANAGPLAKKACQPSVTSVNLATISTLPNPFTFIDGTPVATASDWQCRRQELSDLYQLYELGTLPGPPTKLTAKLTGQNLAITVTQGTASITFTPQIVLPKTGTGPFPAIIAIGGASIPIPSNVAVINFDNSGFAEQNDVSSRGVGLFFTLFPNLKSASATIAWSWGVSRIIDALAITPTANIDITKLGVTGCSRNGKGALIAGAFEPRLALTIPQESGSGGSACWRLSAWQLAHGQTVQTASEIVQENVWESTSFQQFANNPNLLPFDHHELAGMIAPRGLIVIDNPDYLWLGPESCFGCMEAGRLIYQSLGVTNNFGYSAVGNHAHCAFPSNQTADLNAFINKFLLGQNTNTNIFYVLDPNAATNSETNFANFSLSTWANWAVPTLV